MRLQAPNADEAIRACARRVIGDPAQVARSPQWQPVFIGPSAAVFVRRESEAVRRLLPEHSVALATLRNAA